MFTGIIEAVGRVKSIEKKGASGRITVEAGLPSGDPAPGDSVSINGACLTVIEASAGLFTADLSAETLGLTTLKALKAGDRVNVEGALTLSRPIGGHLVTGHVDGMGVVRRITPSGPGMEIEVSVPSGLLVYAAPKGSIAIDGISLTIAGMAGEALRFAVVPFTIERTTLSSRKAGDRVNVETDIIARYVERLLKRDGRGITEGFLAEHGFLGKTT
jgi:riboflavin synthase